MQFRLLSAPGSAALSIWQLQGPVEDLERFLLPKKLPRVGAFGVVRLRTSAGQVFDEALVWRLSAEKLELHLHGGDGVAQALRRRLADAGWQEEAPKSVSPDEERFLAAMAPLNARVAAQVMLQDWEGRLQSIQEMSRQGRITELRQINRWEAWAEVLEKPPRIVLVGPANVGKSTLFNAWLRQERATVSPIPGTTRDSVEATIWLGRGDSAFAATLVDTAGLWSEAKGVDAEAVERTRECIKEAWRRIWVLDAATCPNSMVMDQVMAADAVDPRVLHRSDLVSRSIWSPPAMAEVSWIEGSAHEDAAILVREITRQLLGPLGAPPPADAWIPLGEERRKVLRELSAAVDL